MSSIRIESKPVAVGFDTGYNHAYLILDENDIPDRYDLVIRGGDGVVNINTQVSLPIETSDDKRGSETPNERGSRLITSADAAYKWIVLEQIAAQVSDADITYTFPKVGEVHNSNSVIATLLQTIGIDISAVLPLNATLQDLSGGENILDFGRVIRGTPKSDILFGWQQDDRIYGGEGNDFLYGLGGDDILEAGSGDDVLTGGADSDTYILSNAFGRIVIDDDTGDLDIDGVIVGIAPDKAAEGTLASGHAIKDKDADIWFLDRFTLTMSGGDLLLDDHNQTISIKDFESGNYNIVLLPDKPEEEPEQPGGNPNSSGDGGAAAGLPDWLSPSNMDA